MSSSIGRGVLKGAAIISMFAIAGKALGVIQKPVMAHYFGTGMEADVFTLSFSSIVFTIALFPQQLLSPFLPIFVEKKEKEGEAAAWRFAGSVGTLLVVIMGLVVIGGMILAPHLTAAASSFSSPKAAALSTKLVRVMLPAALFVGLASFLALIHNAHKRFALPAMGDMVNKAVLILCLIALQRFFGIYGLAIGVVAGAIAGVLVQATGLRDQFRVFRFGVDWKDPALRQLGLLMLPMVLSVLIAQLRTIIDYKFASGMTEGSTVGINYARAIVDTLVLLVPTAVGVAIFPFFSDMTAAKDREAAGRVLMQSLRLLMLIFIPVSIALIFLRTPIVQLAFQHGKFNDESVALTVAPLTFYAMGLTSFALEIILMKFYYSIKNTLAPAIIGGLCVLVHLGVILLFRHDMQNASMALAATVSKSAKVIILFVLLGSWLPTLQWKKNGVFLFKTLVAAACMGVVVMLTRRGLDGLLPDPAAVGKMMRLIVLAVEIGAAALAGLVAFGGVAFALRLEELSTMGAWIKSRGRHGNNPRP